MSKFNIEIDVPNPPDGYGPPEWGTWEEGCLWWNRRDLLWDSGDISSICWVISRPLPKPVEYRVPDIAKDWGQVCEFSDDGIKWRSSVLVGLDTDGDWCSEGGVFWEHARIRVDA